MSKIKICKKCGVQMDASAKACPACGAPTKNKKGCAISAIVAFVLIGIVAGTSTENDATNPPVENVNSNVVSSVSTTSEEKEVSSTEGTEESESKEISSVSEKVESEEKITESEVKEESNIYKIGDVLDTGDIKITYQSAEWYVPDNEFALPENGNQILRAYFIIENTGNSDEIVSSFDFKCYADDTAVDEYFWSGDDYLSSTTLSSGRKTEGFVYYEVPEGAEHIEIEYESNYWTQEKVIFFVQ